MVAKAILRELFKRGKSAKFTSEKLGISLDVVNECYKEFDCKEINVVWYENSSLHSN